MDEWKKMTDVAGEAGAGQQLNFTAAPVPRTEVVTFYINFLYVFNKQLR